VIDLCARGGPSVIYGVGSGTITGTAGDDVICGGPGDNIINALGGDDRIYGEGGKDTINGGDGYDLISGGDGDDHINGGASRDEIAGGLGDDLIDGGDGDDWLQGNEGNDELSGGTGVDDVVGAEGDDTLLGGPDADLVVGGVGVDTGDAGDGIDRCQETETVVNCEDGAVNFSPVGPIQPVAPFAYPVTAAGTVEVPVTGDLTIGFSGAGTIEIGAVDVAPLPIRGEAVDSGFVVGYEIDAGAVSFTSAQLRFAIPAAQMSADLGIYWYGTANGVWSEVNQGASADLGTNTVSATVTHFSIYAVLNKVKYRQYLTALANVVGPCIVPNRIFVFDTSGSTDVSGQLSNSGILAGIPLADRPAFVWTLDGQLSNWPSNTTTTASNIDAAFGSTDAALLVPLVTSLATGDEMLLVTDNQVLGDGPVNAAVTAALARGALVTWVLRESFLTIFQGEEAPISLFAVPLNAQAAAVAKKLPDYDGDGWSNCDERRGIISPRSIDSRLDFAGITKTKPGKRDSDGDTLNDGQELVPVSVYGTAMSAEEQAILAAKGISRIGKLVADPNSVDFDKDNVQDDEEVRTFSAASPTLPKPDGQPAIDVSSDPLLPDSDYDGIDDGVERVLGTDPNISTRNLIPGLSKPVVWLPSFAGDLERMNFSVYTTAGALDTAGDPRAIPIELTGEVNLYDLVTAGKVLIGRFTIDGKCAGPVLVCTALNSYSSTSGGRAACSKVGDKVSAGLLPLAISCGPNTNGNVLANVIAQGLYQIRFTNRGYQVFQSGKYYAYRLKTLIVDLRKIYRFQYANGSAATPITSAETQITRSAQKANLLLIQGGKIDLPPEGSITNAPVTPPGGDLDGLPNLASNVRFMNETIAAQEIAGAQTAYVNQIGAAIQGLAVYMEYSSYSQVRDVVAKTYIEPYAKLVAHEYGVAMRATQTSPGVDPMTPASIQKIEDDIEAKCKTASITFLSRQIGAHACKSLPIYVLGGKRLKAGITPVSSMEAAQLRADYWAADVAKGTGDWPSGGSSHKADHRLYNPSQILHYRARAKAWWIPQIPLPAAGTQGCPGPTQAGQQCDEFPNAASFEGGPQLTDPLVKSQAWLRSIAGADNLCDGCSYGQFLTFAGLYGIYGGLVNTDPRIDLKTVDVWDLPELAFLQLSFPDEKVRSVGLRIVNGSALVKFL
jgi:RTX calcium-binding nonapeptide repeat (4 copies)